MFRLRQVALVAAELDPAGAFANRWVHTWLLDA